MREAPEGTIAYTVRGTDTLCGACAADVDDAVPIRFEAQSEGEAPLACTACNAALGNRLSAQALSALIAEVRGWNGDAGEAARVDGLIEAYEDTLRESREVDLLLTYDTGVVCLSDADTQRALVADLRDCDCAGDASHATRRVAEVYSVVAAPSIREGLVGRGYGREDLDEHARNIERAIWLFAWDSMGADEDRDEDPQGLEIELRMRWTGKQSERTQRLAQRARRATRTGPASWAARAEAEGARKGTTWVGARRWTEDGRASVRAVWETDATQEEADEVAFSSVVPDRIGEALARACQREGVRMTELRTIHQPWRASIYAEVEW